MSDWSKQRSSAFASCNSRNKMRLINPTTGELLHLSGKGTVRSLDWSWLGFVHQAERLASITKRRGEDWPFTLIHRETLDAILRQEAPDLLTAGEAAFQIFERAA